MSLMTVNDGWDADPACGIFRKSSLRFTQYPEVGPALSFELCQLFTVNRPHPRRCDRFKAVYLFDAQARLVFIQVLACQTGLLIVWPLDCAAS
jgi:hypothetical protein